MKHLLILITALLLAFPDIINAKDRNNEVRNSLTLSVPVFRYEVNGETLLPISTNGKVGGLIFSTTGDVVITNKRTGQQFSSSHSTDFIYIVDGPEWNIVAKGTGTVTAGMMAYYNGYFYKEGEMVWAEYDEYGNRTEWAWARNGAIMVYGPEGFRYYWGYTY